MTFRSLGDAAAAVVNGLDIERHHIMEAAAALDDRLALGNTHEQEIEQITRCLQFEEDQERRRILRRRFLELTDRDKAR